MSSKLVSCNPSKSALESTLQVLRDHGVLNMDMSSCDRTRRRDFQQASASHGMANTPYGSVIQHFVVENITFEYVHPAAYLYYMVSISTAFRRLMMDVADQCGNEFTYIVYQDAICPGNPFRPDKARKTETVYWAFTQWPDWALCRTFIWPCFALMLTKTIDGIEGGLAVVMATILRKFLDAFASGVILPCGERTITITAKFNGFLADLLAIKQITGWKGTGGLRGCLECGNLTNGRAKRHGEIDWATHDHNSFAKLTRDDLFSIIDELADLAPRLPTRDLQALQTDIGFNHVPSGLLQDRALRATLDPSVHFLRDAMHCLVQDGMLNWETYQIMYSMKHKLVPPVRVCDFRTFAATVHLPKSQKAIDETWLADARFRASDACLHSFASYMLSIVPAMFMFLEYMEIDRMLPAEFDSFRSAHMILQLCNLGPSAAAQRVDTLQTLLETHHAQFTNIYGGNLCKPKHHHSHHLVDHARYLKKLITCWVTERKHKETKRVGLHVFRNYEHVVLRDLLNLQCNQLAEADLFEPEFLSNPQVVTHNGLELRLSNMAMSKFGEIHKGDVVWTSGTCARISTWLELNENIVAVCDIMPMVDGDERLRLTNACVRQFVHLCNIEALLVWRHEIGRPNVVRIVLPVTLFL